MVQIPDVSGLVLGLGFSSVMQTNLFLASKGKQLIKLKLGVFTCKIKKNHRECAAAKTTVFLGLPSPTIQHADKNLCKD